MGPEHVCNVTHLACRTALTRRGVAHINFPADTQYLPVKKGARSERNIPGHNIQVLARRAGVPAQEDLRRAAGILNEGKRHAILAGRGALGATDEILAIADTLGAPIIKALLGKACVPDDNGLTTGGIGLLGTRPSQEAMEECDTLLMVGTSFPHLEFYPKPNQARCVQIDLDAARIGLRYPVEVGLAGDSQRTLRNLLPLLKRNPNRWFLKKGAARSLEEVVGTHGRTRDSQ